MNDRAELKKYKYKFVIKRVFQSRWRFPGEIVSLTPFEAEKLGSAIEPVEDQNQDQLALTDPPGPALTDLVTPEVTDPVVPNPDDPVAPLPPNDPPPGPALTDLVTPEVTNYESIPLTAINGIGEVTAQELAQNGIESVIHLASVSDLHIDSLAEEINRSPEILAQWIEAAKQMIQA